MTEPRPRVDDGALGIGRTRAVGSWELSAGSREETNMKRSGAMALAAALAFGAVTVGAQKPAGYKAPRTPWGDPDLQGNYTNLSEAGTPMERPAEYVGKNMNEFSREELTRDQEDAGGSNDQRVSWSHGGAGQLVAAGLRTVRREGVAALVRHRSRRRAHSAADSRSAAAAYRRGRRPPGIAPTNAITRTGSPT